MGTLNTLSSCHHVETLCSFRYFSQFYHEKTDSQFQWHTAINPPLSLSPFLHTSLFLHSHCSFLRPFTHPSRCKASLSIGPEITHFRHSHYRIGPPAISDSISHNVAPTTSQPQPIDCSLLPFRPHSAHTDTQTLPLTLRLSLLHSHTLVASQMDSTNCS